MLDIQDVPESRKEKARHWLKVISTWSKSGLPISKYCKENKINQSSFYLWSQYLNGKAKAPYPISHKSASYKSKPQTQKITKQFVPLQLESKTPQPNTDSCLRIKLTNGIQIEIITSSNKETESIVGNF